MKTPGDITNAVARNSGFLAGLVLLFATPARAQQPEQLGIPSIHPDSLAGCYELEPGEWQHSESFRQLVNPDRVPRRFQLTTEWSEAARPVQTDSLPYRRVIATPDRYLTTWRRLGTHSDTILVGRPLALHGISLRLARHPDGDLAGRIAAFTDVAVPGRLSHVSLAVTVRRRECGG